ncbi:MAG: sigma 54-interacting transcriptional regulator [Planctomycetes bacterium]|nr:sigma 54-interacting transcriptional regulator [Planctomycetota bacterium]MCB9829634.1 sigma 54-interacting transcriptional regulator [Planctomycetota bacterium]MCB9900121.1 sigma 54-interacting transcriptional regulator [Planctomycetota bacterium]
MPRYILDEKDTRTVYDLPKDVVRIGRAPQNDIAVLDLRASREHCLIERVAPEQYVVRDLGSQNGTRLNGHLVERSRLRPGDELRVGNARLWFEQAPPPDADTDHDPGHSTQVIGLDDERDRLERLQRVVKALNSELHLDPLLRIILDHVVEIAGAERGFLVLQRPGPDGGATVHVARNFEQEDVQSPEAAFSQSIVERVLASGEAVLTANAVEDERFSGALSISAIRARSVLCLPFQVRGRTAGAVYVDNRLQAGAFGDAERDMLTSLVDLAATAIERASLYEENEQRLIEVDDLNQRLELRVEGQARELTEVRDRLRKAGAPQGVYPQIIGESQAMRDVLRLLDKIVRTDEPVLITGESGTGKELIARAIHAHGPRARQAFLSENCAALTDTLLESELFGHVRGAFTGADRDKKGLFELADQGTLFLDEVADMSPDMQKKLLRTLQEGEVRPVGGKSVRKVDVRIVSASNKRLDRLVRAGEFREDLYYRLRVLTIDLPPLRDRKEDIPLLADHFLRLHAGKGRAPKTLGPGVAEALQAYDWPGNIRELENEVKRMVALGDDVITADILSEPIRRGGSGRPSNDDGPVRNLVDLVENVERTEIEKALRQAEGNKTKAADLLGISRFTLQRKLEKYAMEA